MHIPDWDEAFLKNFDPKQAAKEALSTGAEGVMVYFQSHAGFCNWPTQSGVQHAAFAGRDPMRVIVDTLRNEGAGICAYYSTIFNSWAANAHPEWRIEAAAASPMGPLPMARYGLCCPNNPGYRDFVRAQTREIARSYDVDVLFFDMMWWPAVCLCRHCEARSEKEIGAPIPKVLNWRAPVWCAFQDARERWIAEFAEELRDLVHTERPETSVYHNFALAMSNWSRGVSFASARAHDFLGGDFYGGREEQLVISRLMANLSPGRPTEFMTTVARNLVDHEQLQSAANLKMQVYGALGCGSAFLMIAALDPDGRNNPAMLARIRETFDETAPYEPFIGGEAIEDIGVYFSDASKMNFADDGTDLANLPCSAAPDYPHFRAVRGACRKLAAAHLPFGVITEERLDRLADYKVIVLPNLLRMRPCEIEAFRAYVAQGGRIYASRMTSLTLADGAHGDDFALADVFGCHLAGEDAGRMIYAKPACGLVADALAPERYLGHRAEARGMSGAVRLRAGDGEALATLSLPYGHPHGGTMSDQNWSSIHSDPPWTHTQEPAIVASTYGDGRSVFSAADIEAGDSNADHALFIALIRELLGGPASFEADAPPAVWATVFDQPEKNRIVLSFLNYQLEMPPIPIARIPFRLAPPPGSRFKRLVCLPDMREAPMELSETSGRLAGVAENLETFAMYAAEYE